MKDVPESESVPTELSTGAHEPSLYALTGVCMEASEQIAFLTLG